MRARIILYNSALCLRPRELACRKGYTAGANVGSRRSFVGPSSSPYVKSSVACPCGERLPTSQSRDSRAMGAINMDLKALSASYSIGLKPSDMIQRLYPLLAAEIGMFITLLSLEDLLARCRFGAAKHSRRVLQISKHCNSDRAPNADPSGNVCGDPRI